MIALSVDDGLACYRRMLLIRFFEEKLSALFSENRIGGTSHFCIGQEACAVGVVAAARDSDYLVSNHRGHGHLLARGLEPMRVFAELMGRRAGFCRGRGGSQHLCAMERAFLGTNGITGGGIPIATGAALALKCQGSDRIVIAFFGDGATNQGTFHESLNMAALWKLPVLYVCENNLYGMSMPVAASTACLPIARRAASYSMPGVTCDGNDVFQVRGEAQALIESVRAGGGPALLELETYRFCGHSKNDPRAYRQREEEERWAQRDCLKVAAAALQQAAGVAATELQALTAAVKAEIEAAATQALACPFGGDEDAVGGVYA
jgi:pyruvate dehydrogenase E1 component alpha subunit